MVDEMPNLLALGFEAQRLSTPVITETNVEMPKFNSFGSKLRCLSTLIG